MAVYQNLTGTTSKTFKIGKNGVTLSFSTNLKIDKPLETEKIIFGTNSSITATEYTGNAATATLASNAYKLNNKLEKDLEVKKASILYGASTAVAFQILDETNDDMDVYLYNQIPFKVNLNISGSTSSANISNSTLLLNLPYYTPGATKVETVVDASSNRVYNKLNINDEEIDLIQIDTSLSILSTNPVQNKVITNKIAEIKKGNFDNLSANKLTLTPSENSTDATFINNGKSEFLSNVNINADLTIGGDLYVNGKTTLVESQTLVIQDKLLEIGKNTEASGLIGYAGIYVPNYDGTNSGALVFDKTGTAYVGDVTITDGDISDSSNLQALATRPNSVTDNSVMIWSASKNSLVESSKLKDIDYVPINYADSTNNIYSKYDINSNNLSIWNSYDIWLRPWSIDKSGNEIEDKTGIIIDDTSLRPAIDGAVDLGTKDQTFNDAYFSGIVSANKGFAGYLDGVANMAEYVYQPTKKDDNNWYDLTFYSASTTANNKKFGYADAKKIQYNPSTGTLKASTFSGNLNGTASYASYVAIEEYNETEMNETLELLFIDPTSKTVKSTSLLYNSNLKYNFGSGTLIAPNFSGTFSGNASSATAIKVANTTSDNNYQIPFITSSLSTASSTANLGFSEGAKKVLFNPSTGTLTVDNYIGSFSGNLTGNASTATTAGEATNLVGGAAYKIPYQTAASTTSFISAWLTATEISNGNKAMNEKILVLSKDANIPTWQTNNFLRTTGGTITGNLNISASTQIIGVSRTLSDNSGNAILNAGYDNLTDIGAIFLYKPSKNATNSYNNGINFITSKTSTKTTADTLYTKNNKLYFAPNRTVGVAPSTNADYALLSEGDVFSNGVVPVTKGGTGKNTLTADEILLGNGTNAIKSITASAGILKCISSTQSGKTVYSYNFSKISVDDISDFTNYKNHISNTKIHVPTVEANVSIQNHFLTADASNNLKWSADTIQTTISDNIESYHNSQDIHLKKSLTVGESVQSGASYFTTLTNEGDTRLKHDLIVDNDLTVYNKIKCSTYDGSSATFEATSTGVLQTNSATIGPSYSAGATINTTLTNTGHAQFNNNVNVSGNLTVKGNLTIQGNTTVIEATTVQSKDQLIELGHGRTTALTTPAGIYVPKYDGTNSGALVFDKDGIAYVGDVTFSGNDIDVSKSQLQPLATRSLSNSDDKKLIVWDSTNKTLKAATKQYIPIVYHGSNIKNEYQSKSIVVNIDDSIHNFANGTFAFFPNIDYVTNPSSATYTNGVMIENGLFKPYSNNTVDLGTSNTKFKNGYFAGTVTASTFSGNLNGTATTAQTIEFGDLIDENVGEYAVPLYDIFGDSKWHITDQLEPNVVVKYNASTGTFIAPKFSGTLLGHASSASTATAVKITKTSSNSTYYVPLVNYCGSSDSKDLYVGDGTLAAKNTIRFNPSTGVLTADTFSGSLSGTASNAAKVSIEIAAANDFTPTQKTAIMLADPNATAGSSGHTLVLGNADIYALPYTGTIVAKSFSGNLSGNASTANFASRSEWLNLWPQGEEKDISDPGFYVIKDKKYDPIHMADVAYSSLVMHSDTNDSDLALYLKEYIDDEGYRRAPELYLCRGKYGDGGESSVPNSETSLVITEENIYDYLPDLDIADIADSVVTLDTEQNISNRKSFSQGITLIDRDRIDSEGNPIEPDPTYQEEDACRIKYNKSKKCVQFIFS